MIRKNQQALTNARGVMSVLCLVDTNGKLIAQQREDKPGITNPGMVSLFGGTSHEGESPIETLRRELQEELELEVSSNNLLLQTVKHENGTNVACSIYIVTRCGR